MVFRSHSSDAGRLFLVDSIPKFHKDPTAPVLRLFTQVVKDHFAIEMFSSRCYKDHKHNMWY